MNKVAAFSMLKLADDVVPEANPGRWWCSGIRDAAAIIRSFGDGSGWFLRWWKKPLCYTIAFGLEKIAEAKCGSVE